jgi:hypothetical protein
VNATEPVPTTFLRFLGWMVPGDYSTINVNAVAEAGPERPVDLMLVLDRSGSMKATDGTGTKKIDALKQAVNAFLGLQNTFSANDRIGLISFATRGCGVNGSESTAAVCSPDVGLSFADSGFISTLQSKVNALDANGGTNTMEALRTAKPPLAQAFADSNRATTRKAVLLVTDGQPTFLRREASGTDCQRNPKDNASILPSGPNGCVLGVRTYPNNDDDYQVLRGSLSSPGNLQDYPNGGSNANWYRDFIRCTRSMTGDCAGTNGAMHEANQLRNCGYNNSACTAGGEHGVLVFVIAIGKKDLNAPQQSLDENAKCLLSRVANATDIVNAATGVVETMTQNCNNKFPSIDGDTHDDLLFGWPCGSGPCIDTTQQKGKVYTIDVTGDVNAQLQQVFAEIAAILKLRLVL